MSSPVFERVVLDGADSRRRITVDAPGAARAQHVALRVDGRATTRSWLPSEFAREGGRLTFRMAARPGAWGTGARDVPPSYTDGTDARNNVGTTPDGHGGLGSLDLSDNSLSRERLAQAGAAPGARLPPVGTGIEFVWPLAGPGEPDNWTTARPARPARRPAGHGDLLPGPGHQRSGAGQRGGPVHRRVHADGAGRVHRLDDRDDLPVRERAAGDTTGRNRAAGGSDTAQTKMFGTRPVALDPAKREPPWCCRRVPTGGDARLRRGTHRPAAAGGRAGRPAGGATG